MPAVLKSNKVIVVATIFFGGFLFFLTFPSITHAISINNVVDNRSEYANGQVPKYEKFEITFQVDNVAPNVNFYLPFANTYPAGISDNGVTVNATFTDPNGETFVQPAFYFQEYLDQVITNKDWLYPTSNFSWKIRFAPHKIGNWSFVINAQDASGSSQSNPINFTVSASSNKGFIKVSPTDTRYFEYDDGTYFPGLGFNLNAGNIDFINPTLGNINEFSAMGENGAELSRVWISQKSIFGSVWGQWSSHNPVHQTQEPAMGLAYPGFSQFSRYPNLDQPFPTENSDVYMWLNFDETMQTGNQWWFTPCRTFRWESKTIPLKQNTNYKVRVRYQEKDFLGKTDPNYRKDPSKRAGFVIKEGGFLWNASNESARCYWPGTGTVIAATYDPQTGENWTNYPDPIQGNANNGWRILEGNYNSGTKSFVTDRLYLAMENAKSPGDNQSGGHVFVDYVWFEEDLGGGNLGPNIINKPWMAHHKYVNQRDAHAFDLVLNQAKQYGMKLKAVMLDKNDSILQAIDPNTGNFVAQKQLANFFGGGRETDGDRKVRFLQKAWWRYMQGRWGYSTNIHSWELLNEGPEGNNEGHWYLADEFGEYMNCGVFGIDEPTNINYDCNYNHPNNHPVTTSIWGGGFPILFWTNSSGQYNDVDYVDVHEYANEGIEDPALFNDAALFSQANSVFIFGQNVNKPVIRGETGWTFIGTNLFEQNVTNGLWLHNFIWGGINYGGLMEHFFAGGNFTKQIYCVETNPNTCPVGNYDHRPMFGTYFRFIKDIPLNNGNYEDAGATATDSNFRVWGQKDMVNDRAHLWIQNKNHTWKNVYLNNPINPISGEVTIGGFDANKTLSVEWWDTYTGNPTTVENKTTDSSGNLSLTVTNLTTDTAVKIGDYVGVLGDINNDGNVNIQDYILLSNAFGTTNPDADLNDDGTVNIQDYIILSNNFGN